MATSEVSAPKTLGKVRPHQTQNEALVFEKSSPGKRACFVTGHGFSHAERGKQGEGL